MKKHFLTFIFLVLLVIEAKSQFAKGSYLASVNYSSFGIYDVRDTRLELRLGHFFLKNFSAGLFGSYESRPYTTYGNNFYGGYDGYSFGLFGQKYFHIYKSLYLSLTLDAVRGKSTITPPNFSSPPDYDYTLVNTRLSLVYRPIRQLGIELSNGWLNYTYLYLPYASPQQSYFKFNYGNDPNYFPRWFIGVSYYLSPRRSEE